MNIDRDKCHERNRERGMIGNNGGEKLFLLRARRTLRS